ncbi:MAG: hypothetical protein QM654_17750 [Dysgonamonadaceae bacterium]
MKIHAEDILQKARLILSDATVQENNTPFPTDAKLVSSVFSCPTNQSSSWKETSIPE